ncbi:hypothetical protein [Desulfogranum japonicum]|uniref:hypothetical protein n=1 Tax=Desulfogranum japonicum TaxID=231447 RepID=UPI0003F5BAD9|nr:hypothetical protein [Desulfogranum japonicum]
MKKRIVLLLSFCFFSGEITSAATRYIRTDGTDTGQCSSVATPCKSIQYAINRAAEASNDTIRIASGTYNEAVVIPSSFQELHLTLSGGWNDDFSLSCNGQPTILTAPDTSQSVIKMFDSAVWNTLDLNLTCINFQGNGLTYPLNAISMYSNRQNSMELSLDRCTASHFPGQALLIQAENSAQLTVQLNEVRLEHNSALLNGNWSGIGLFARATDADSVLDLDLENCWIRDNVGDNDQQGGGGVSLNAGEGGVLNATMTNTVIVGNEKDDTGAGLRVAASGTTSQSVLELDLINSTISGNRSLSFPAGGGLSVYAGNTSKTTVRLKNTIVWGNENSQGANDDIYLYENALNNEAEVSLTSSYSILSSINNEENQSVFTDGGHNLSVDPCLRSDYHLRRNSPAIDAGQCGTRLLPLNTYYRIAPLKDIDGEDRPPWGEYTGCDIGADEYFPRMLCFPIRTGKGDMTMICM